MSETTMRRKKKGAPPPKKDDSDSDQKEKKEKKDEHFSDDDETIEILEKNAQQKKSEYDLKKGLQLEVTTERTQVQVSTENSQKLTTVVSLKTLEVTYQENQNFEELAPSEDRLPIDLITVIDCSGSMNGKKIETVMKALEILLTMFSEKDRLSIVKFDSYSQKLLKLTRTTQANLPIIQDKFQKGLVTGGSTNIPSGIEKAIDILVGRKHFNKIVSIFLLSDGIDDNRNHAIDVINETLIKKATNIDFSIHTFGFGNDHDSTLLSGIAKLRYGNFYYIEDLEKINECFINAFGGLLSIVGQNAIIRVGLYKNPEHIKELTDIKWYKTYGDFWVKDENTNEYIIDLKNLMNGMKRDFVVDVQIPKIKSKIIDLEREERVLYAEICAYSIDNNEKVVVKKDLKVNFFNEDEEFKQEENKLNSEVLYNIFRVQVAEVMEKAVVLSDHKQYDEAIKDIENCLMKLTISSASKDEKVKKLIEQLQEAKNNCKPDVYQAHGKHSLINSSEVTMKQRGLKNKKQSNLHADDEEDENENTVQKTLKRKMISKKVVAPKPEKIDNDSDKDIPKEKAEETVQRKKPTSKSNVIEESSIKEVHPDLEQSNIKQN